MFDIVMDNPDFLVINKHPNVSVHKDDGDTSLLLEISKATGYQSLFLVHRLDKMTSGLLLLAKNHQAASELSQQFADRAVTKFYLAIGVKKPKKKQGLISGDMERSRRSSWKLTTTQTNPAQTQFFSVAGESGERVFLCKPKTGKTHQIRVALNSIGSSIVGDPIYTPSSNADRGYLHAYALKFQYQGNIVGVHCDPSDPKWNRLENMGEKWQSEAVQHALKTWGKPCQLDWPVIKTNK
ncbi:TIGR01621 family pseudouridine synthase [Vibrio algicola]|uniref:TIGR01621 family pseudouridine synthase n=1 Tax=Vibrio algicola TaxID=2662262 RepID=A0A5Q0TCH9_9VIBR|nr:TIGR01621 family pseudouridine synthase [Vibrio algicola]